MGLLDVGYHLVIDRLGNLHRVRDITTIGSHTPGYNHLSIGVCLIGGLDVDGKVCDNFHKNQKAALRLIASAFLKEYPGSIVVAHKDLKGYGYKKCPALDVQQVHRYAMHDLRTVGGIRPLSVVLDLAERRTHEPEAPSLS
jgi:hypothetical protein